MKPFVGLPVLFTGKHFHPSASKYAAVVASVQSDSLVNLAVSNEHGNTYGVSSVRFVCTPDDIIGGENYCEPNPKMMERVAVEIHGDDEPVTIMQTHDPED
jgi:hypothetical protein